MSAKAPAAAVAALVVGIALGAGWRGILPSKIERPIDNARTPSECLLSGAPGVRDTKVLIYAERKRHRIIQIDDAHFVNLADFAQAAREASARSGLTTTDAEIRGLYCDYVDDLIDLRNDQFLLLRWLVDRHGLESVFCEGLPDEGVAPFLRSVGYLNRRRTTIVDLAETMRNLPRLADENGEYTVELQTCEKAVEALLDAGMYAGAIAQLVIERPFVKVLAVEDRVALEEAYSEITAGKRGEKNKFREAVIVKRLLARPGCSVVVLGAGHDLSAEIRKQSHGDCEYVKVTPARDPRPPLVAVGGDWPLHGAGSR
jgi:hypothetical protein